MNLATKLATAAVLAAIVSNTAGTVNCLALPHAPSIAPVQMSQASDVAKIKSSAGSDKIAATKIKFARIAAAAICTDDLATISFPEYSVDWSSWVEAVANRWTSAMNSTNAAATAGLRPSGPMFVEFTAKRDGAITDVIIDRSSGDRLCDAAQIKTLLHCLPLPSFPALSRKQNITILCIWSYEHGTPLAKSAKRHVDTKNNIRVSITRSSL